MAIKKHTRNFLILAPILLLLAGGIFVRTLRESGPKVASIVTDFSGEVETGTQMAIFEGKRFEAPFIDISKDKKYPVLGVASPSEKWVEVDLSEQKLRAWDGTNLFLESLVSTGLPGFDTPTGEFHIWIKLRATRMEGGQGRYYYNLPNVPYVMFFENDKVPSWKGFSLHGTYWHNDFGKVHSHGCVNLPTPIAEKIYWWSTPTLPAGKNTVYSSAENPGTRIVIHE